MSEEDVESEEEEDKEEPEEVPFKGRWSRW